MTETEKRVSRERCDMKSPSFEPYVVGKVEIGTLRRVPLGFFRRARLLVDCLPGLFGVLVTVVLLVVGMARGVGQGPLALMVGGGLIIAVCTFVNPGRDLVSGVAIECIVVPGSGVYVGRGLAALGWGWADMGEFEHIGKLYLTNNARCQMRQTGRHRLTYSPATRTAWAMEPLAES